MPKRAPVISVCQASKTKKSNGNMLKHVNAIHYDFFGLKTLFDDFFSLGYFQYFSSKHKLCVLARSTILKLLPIYVVGQKTKKICKP